MNADDVAEWVRTHKKAAVIGGAGLGLVVVVLYLRHRRGSTASTTGATTDGGGQYLVPYTPATDPSVGTTGTMGDSSGGDTGQLGDVLAALNDLTTTDAGLASGLGDLNDQLGSIATTLGNLKPVKSTNPNGHKGKSGKAKKTPAATKKGGHAQHGKTKTKNPTPGGHGHGGNTGHTSQPKHKEPTTKLVNPKRPKAPSAAQRKATTHKANPSPVGKKTAPPKPAPPHKKAA